MKFLLVAGFAESILTFRGPLIEALFSQGLKVHVAAPDVPIGSEIRKALMEKAEKIAIKNNYSKIAVISGVGVRGYYRKLGYSLKDTYMIKKLK